MAGEVQKILGQNTIAAAANADVCTPGATVNQVVAVLLLANDHATITAVCTIYARKAGAAIGAGTKAMEPINVPAQTTEVVRIPFTLGGAAGDILSVAVTGAQIIATAMGAEVTP